MNILERDFFTYIRNIDNYNIVCEKEKMCFQHGTTTVLKHSRNVAYSCLVLAKKLEKKFNMSFDYETLVTGAFLHDFFIYDWHEKEKGHRLHGYTHPKVASKNAVQICNVNNNVCNIIKTHMWPLTLRKIPTSREAFVVCMVDKYIALMETLEKFKKGKKYRNEICNTKSNAVQALR